MIGGLAGIGGVGKSRKRSMKREGFFYEAKNKANKANGALWW
jgi:hypothetical protein